LFPERLSGVPSLGDDGDANKLFLTYLIDMVVGIQFLKDVGLILSNVTYNTCGRDMTWCAEPKRKDDFRLRYRRRAVAVCSESKSFEHGSWLQHSKLTFQEVMILTYIVRRVPARLIQ
jgi:hypothetical protein